LHLCDFSGMFWPEVLRGSAAMFFILPPMRTPL
jgi:hypothetical protein